VNPSRRRFLEVLGTGAPGALFAGRLERYLMSTLPPFSAPGVLLDVIGSQERVEIQEFQHVHQRSWNFWSTVWMPQTPGPDTLRARPLDDAIPTQRLDTGYYVRRIQVPQI
jgi:hypothetical protein